MVPSKKGVESIIAVVLILMITVASASSFFFWYNGVQQSAQGRAEYSTTTFLNQMMSCVKIPYLNYNLLNNESEVQIQNCGTTSVTIGDGDDNLLITSEPCAAELDSTNCDICPFTISRLGALATFKIKHNYLTCAGTTAKSADLMAEEGNLEHKITFSIDGTTSTASKTFVPTKILSCTITLSEPVDVNIPIGPAATCIDYQATTDSTIAQTFTISSTTTDPVNCPVTSIHDGASCTGAAISQKTFAAEETGSFSVLVNANPGLGGCYITTKLTSTDLSTCSDTDTVWLFS